MNIAAPLGFKPNSSKERVESPVHRFFERHQNALYHAAHLLGGSDGANLVSKAAEALRRELALSRRTVGLLNQVKDILFLENVGDPDRPESGFFAEIDPADPVVEEICLLAEGLDEVLRASFGACANNGRAADATQLCRYSARSLALGDL